MPSKAPTEVVVAVLFDDKGRFLMSSRPEGKVYSKFWEFPGGKVEPGETLEQALKREMLEELGVELLTVKEVLTQEVTYPHDTVRLHFFQCRKWLGAIEPKEHQTYGFFCGGKDLPSPILPGTIPVLDKVTGPCS